jgi:hypothetical protein
MNGEPRPVGQNGKHTFELPVALEDHNVARFKQFEFIKLELKSNIPIDQPGGVHQRGSRATA